MKLKTTIVLLCSVTCFGLVQSAASRGEKVDIGGYKLYYQISGKGSPTVIMDAGRSLDSTTWRRVWPAVSEFTRVLIYDRAGLGKSDPGPQPRTSRKVAEELYALLTNAGIHGPYILVGHSFGGINMRMFADRYPKQVAGMVLVDTNHPDQMSSFLERVPAEDRPILLKNFVPPPKSEFDTELSLEEVRATRPLGDIPLVVLAEGIPVWTYLSAKGLQAAEQAWLELQRNLAKLSSDSVFIVAEKSGHFIQLDQPDLVINAIRQVVSKARRNQAK